MERLERFYQIDRLLKEQKAVAFSKLRTSLGVSAATLKRDLEYIASSRAAQTALAENYVGLPL